MRILICEDNYEIMQHNVSSVKKALSKLHLTADILTYLDGDGLLQGLQKNNDVDYIFLDILLPASNGIDIARSIRKINEICYIIFVTATKNFAIDGYQVNAFRYLMKPLTEESIEDVFNTTLKHIKSRHLLLSINQESIPVEKKDIIYAVTSGRKTSVVTKNKTYTSYMKMDDLEAKLDNTFVRCHKSYLVNLAYCQCIKANDLTLKNMSAIPISRQYIKTTKQAFFEFYSKN